MMPPADLRGRSLLAVFAHPDDESITSGGLLAWCAHLGAEVALLCLTHGEHGQPGGEQGQRGREHEQGGGELGHGENDHGQDGSHPVQGAGALARTRRRELEGAARALGVKTVTLLDHEDGMLPWLDAARLEADVAAAIRRQQPDAVITFDEDGAYGHPDHVAVHERTTAAVAALGEGAPALYYVTMPPGAMRAVADHAASAFRGGDDGTPPGGPGQEGRGRRPPGASRTPPAPTSSTVAHEGRGRRPPGARHEPSASVPPGTPPTSILGVRDPDAFGAEAPVPTLVVDAGAFASAKLAALACHATQFRGSALEAVAPEDAPRLLGIEHYRRAVAGMAGPSFLDAFGASPAVASAEERRSSLSDRSSGVGRRRTP